MQRVDPKSIGNEASNRVWSVVDFAKRNRLTRIEEVRLSQLFGSYATASELQNNAKRPPRYHQ